MELTPDEIHLRDEACEYLASRKDELIKKFILDKHPLRLGFVTIFMAGSPGAGKTEFSQRYLPSLFESQSPELSKRLRSLGINPADIGTFLVRIDVDEIRTFLPHYKKAIHGEGKGNAHVIQAAANKGLDTLREFCFAHDISFLHDGTFGNLSTMRDLVRRSLNGGRDVHIYYLYLDPIAAWEFTKAREFIEGRNILKEKFIEQYYNSKANVDQVRREFDADEHFKGRVKIHCVLKDEENQVLDVTFNVPSIDKYLETNYNKGIIRPYTPEDLSKLLT